MAQSLPALPGAQDSGRRAGFRRDLALVWQELPRGKSLSRTLTNAALARFEVDGDVVDVGGVGRESHYRFLRVRETARIRNVNVDSRADVVLDFDGRDLPFPDASQDRVHCFNICEHVYHLAKLLAEAWRILKPGGALLGSVPFLVNVHPDPHDFARYTAEYWVRVLTESRFRDVQIDPIGRGPYTAALSLVDFTIPRFLRPLAATAALGIDRVLDALRPRLALAGKFPMAYVFSAAK